MFEALEKSIKGGLKGNHIHMTPLKALEGLTAETARTLPSKGEHSCWHILHHIVFWQDLMLSALRKESVNWPKNNEVSWPSDDQLKKDDDWVALVESFKKGLEESDGLTNTIESMDDLPAWPKVPPFAALMVLIQHNAFHFGEIVATRQALGIWPPPEYKPTF